MNELGALLLTLVTGACLTALFIGLEALFPRRFGRTLRVAEEAPGRSFLVGLANLLFFGAIGLGFTALSNGLGAPILLVPALVILAVISVALVLGLAAIGGLIGERTWRSASRNRQRIIGSVLMILGSLTPFIGWFLLFPYLALLALGAFILGWFRPPQASDDETLPLDPGELTS